MSQMIWTESISPLVFPGEVTGFIFAFRVVIDGVKYKTGMGKTKKDARLKAAQLALQEFLPTLDGDSSAIPDASGLDLQYRNSSV